MLIFMLEQSLRCLIVDDEDLAVDLLVNYVQRTPGLTLAGTCFHALDAQKVLTAEHVDILLVDIQMPFLTGLDFVQQLKNPPYVIFTTSYSEHAVDAFSLSATDYLLKPFTYERFEKAIKKVFSDRTLMARVSLSDPDHFFVKSDSRMVKIYFTDLLYIEGLKQYVKIFKSSGVIITLESLKKLEELLPTQEFMRVHKSYIVALGKAEGLSRKEITIAGKKIPVGKTFELEWLKAMERFK
jgi:two-component system, LytTR family, response regulator